MKFSAAHDPVWANEEQTAINLIIETDQFGFIPFTASRGDPEAHGREIFAMALRGDFGSVADYPKPQKSIEQIEQEITAAVRDYLDSVVQLRGYDNIVAACSYVASTTASYKAEGEACVEWRDKVWAAVFAIISEIKDGTDKYVGADAVIPALPAISWPIV